MFNYALFDIDNTLSRGYVLRAMMDNEAEAGFLDSAIYAEMKAAFESYQSGQGRYIHFADTIMNLYAKAAKGQQWDDLEICNSIFLSRNRKNLFYDYAEPVIAMLREAGFRVILVTTEPEFQAAAVRSLLNAEGFLATKLSIENRVFDGRIERMLATSEQKMNAIAKRIGDVGKIALAFGDSDSDIGMLCAAENAVLINAESPALLSKARLEGWFTADGKNKKAILRHVRRVIDSSTL